MGRTAPRPGPWSRAIYARLLALYPAAFLQRHRAELLQNFEDIAQTSSTLALWRIIGKDLMISLIASYARSPLARYVVGVLVAWAAVFAIGYVRVGSTPGYPVLHVFGGFLLGMLSMYIATRIYRPGRNGAQT